MKKNLLRLITCVLALISVVSMAACSGKPSTSSAADGSAPASSQPAVSEPVSDPASEPASGPASTPESAVDANFVSIEDFIKSDMMQEQIKTMNDSIAEEGCSLEVTAEGDQMIYAFTFGDLEGIDVESLAATLNETLDQTASIYETLASQLKAMADDPSVKVIYAAADGTEICSRVFTAQ